MILMALGFSLSLLLVREKGCMLFARSGQAEGVSVEGMIQCRDLRAAVVLRLLCSNAGDLSGIVSQKSNHYRFNWRLNWHMQAI